jgi:hypothetical protein
MKRFKFLGLALVAMFVVAGAVSAMAFALPTLLNASGELAGVVKYTAHSTGTIARLTKLNGKEVQCKTATSEGEFTKNSVLGPFHITFSTCKGLSGLVTCTGTGDASGVILSLGTAHLVYDSLTTLGVAALLLVGLTTFECAGIAKVETKGELLCLLKPINTLALSGELNCTEKVAGDGDPGEVTYWNASGAPVNVAEGLLAKEGSGEFEMSGETAEASINYAKEDYEVMG